MALINKIRKRDGRVVDFDQEKITEAIWKAAQAVGGKDRKISEGLSNKVVAVMEYQFSDKEIPTVEEIQDIVEKILIKNGHAKTAKNYILYRHQHEKIRETKSVMVDAINTISEYLNQSDWRVRENSNEAFSFSGLLLHTAGKVMSNYNLSEMYAPHISEAHKKAYIHIHDLSHGVIAYCAGWSLKNLLIRGFGGVPNKVDCKPAKHMSTVVHQMVNYIGCLQMEFAGAQAFSSVDTLLAPFVVHDKLDYKKVKQNMQQLVFSLNIPSRWGSQYPFSNLTFDWTVPADMAEQKAMVGGKEQSFTDGDSETDIDDVLVSVASDLDDVDGSGTMETQLRAGNTYLVTVTEATAAEEADVVPFAFLLSSVTETQLDRDELEAGNINIRFQHEYYHEANNHSKIQISGECEDDEGNNCWDTYQEADEVARKITREYIVDDCKKAGITLPD